jgi:hypothetical protein
VHSLALAQLWRAATKARISSFASHVARERARSSSERPGVSSRRAQSLGLVPELGGVVEVDAAGADEGLAVGGSDGGAADAASDADGGGVVSGAEGTDAASDAGGAGAASDTAAGSGVLTREQSTSAGALAATSNRVTSRRVKRARVRMA